MAKSRQDSAGIKYKLLRGADNDKTGKRYEAGDTVVAGVDFSGQTLEHWASTSPPRAEAVGGRRTGGGLEDDDGKDAQ